MNLEKRLQKLRNSPANVRFGEACAVAEAVGFIYVRTHGSHHIYQHRDHPDVALNLQEVRGKAKAYQIRDLLAKISRYNLSDG